MLLFYQTILTLQQPVSKRMKGFKKQRLKQLKDSLNDKIEEFHILHMNLPFKIISKRGKVSSLFFFHRFFKRRSVLFLLSELSDSFYFYICFVTRSRVQSAKILRKFLKKIYLNHSFPTLRHTQCIFTGRKREMSGCDRYSPS